jgi:hypothetical protein
MSKAFQCDKCERPVGGESNLTLSQHPEWSSCEIRDGRDLELCNQCISSLQRWFKGER